MLISFKPMEGDTNLGFLMNFLYLLSFFSYGLGCSFYYSWPFGNVLLSNPPWMVVLRSPDLGFSLSYEFLGLALLLSVLRVYVCSFQFFHLKRERCGAGLAMDSASDDSRWRRTLWSGCGLYFLHVPHLSSAACFCRERCDRSLAYILSSLYILPNGVPLCR